ncbi:cytochrome d ubiquinol oxidase subunit II [Salinibacterium sp. G-O1]|uniref:cytochrome d ubiquinol oxidase subunit II n=1 Tax=Salinibacterium sp. G-O1 TaxID=3046208 RepID=UPI0024BB7641|nr:cytochrome d ubiquinol oxidase subunit II [Salinibacterium sp. G-O1]MDJ0336222.1 cytochrome d ubiquinol oxidase subunit II [Salinibacterium sp. G-O1]
MEFLPTLWFVAIAALWIGYLLLEGFDLGVGMHMLVSARTEKQRRLMLNSIGPVWDGNEVWLITAGAATFAAFPLWYASLFSTLYIPLTLTLLALIFRAVAIEYRGKGDSDRWRAWWDRALGIGSFVTAFGVGAMLTLTTTGLPIDANGDRVGGPFAWLNGYAILGGLAVIGFCLVHGAVFLSLKTLGPVRDRSRAFVVRWAPVALLPIVGWVLAVQLASGTVITWGLVVLAVAAVVYGWVAARAGREGRAFAGIAAFLVLGAASIFAAAFPVVIPSTIDSAFDLTVTNASSGEYTLGVMSVVTAIGLPLVLLYQGYTYWVFRRRLAETHLPDAHTVLPAVASR